LSEACQSAEKSNSLVRFPLPRAGQGAKLIVCNPGAVSAPTPCCSPRSCLARSWLATMLAYEAHDAAQSHRAAAERTLHDYAAVAAWELVAGVNESLQSSLAPAFAFITRSRAPSPYDPPPGAHNAGRERRRCVDLRDAEGQRVAFLFSCRLPRRISRLRGCNSVATHAAMAHRHHRQARARDLSRRLELCDTHRRSRR